MSDQNLNMDYLKEIRKNFPRIEKDFSAKKRIFLDNGAGSLVLKDAAEAEKRSRLNFSANIGAFYSESKENEIVIQRGREAVADLLNAPNPGNIYQSESASDIFFKISFALRHIFDKDSNVVSTYAEHWSNVAPYLQLKKDGKISEVQLAKVSYEDGTIDMSELASLVNSKTKLIAITAESNLLGNKTDLIEVSKIAKENGSLFLVDGVHYTPQSLVDVKKLDCDFFVFSGYKIFGPRGSFAYVSDRVLDLMKPYYVDREAKPHIGSYLELGTRDQGIFAAITAVVNYISRLSLDIKRFKRGSLPKKRREAIEKGMKKVENYQRELSMAILYGVDDLEGLTSIKNISLYGITDKSRIDERGSTFSFNFKNINDKMAEQIFWEKFRITVVGGNHWNLTHDFYSNQSMLRVTFLHYNTIEEVKSFLRAAKWISLR